MKREVWLLGSCVLAVVALYWGASISPSLAQVSQQAAYEVWMVDQSDTRPDGGGTLYIYQGRDLSGPDAAKATPEVIDLGGAVRDLCLEKTGSAPRRPHMLLFNATGTHAILAFVATGHVVFFDAATRAPLAAIDVGAQAHAAFPSPDGRYVVVANQNGKLLQRINTDYAANTFTLGEPATLNLAVGTTPTGAPREDATLRPDNAPICPLIDASSRFSFVTLRGGGLFVVDSTVTPMAIVAEYDRTMVNPNGCGGIQVDGKMYINSGGGTPAHPAGSDLYVFPIAGFSTLPGAANTPAPKLVFSHNDRPQSDSHGMTLTRGGYLWVADRFANSIISVDTRSDQVVKEINLVGALSNDPTPDLLDISPSGDRVFMTLRGPNPLSGNVPEVHNAQGSTPGLGIVRVDDGGRNGVFEAVVPISNLVNGNQLADPHAVRVRAK